FITGQALNAFCFAAAMCALMSKYEPMAWFYKTDIRHDIGKLMLAFTMFWAYLSFSQFLIIWSANLPEEITFYIRRIHGEVWPYISGALVIAGFCIPYAALLSKDLKKNMRSLTIIAVYTMAIRYLDIYWYVKPTFQDGPQFSGKGLLDLAAVVGLGGIWL